MKGEVSIHGPIQNKKLSIFEPGSKQGKRNKVKQDARAMKSDAQLFSRLFISCQTRDGDLDNCFQT
jgi:hypothetical protein